MLGRKIKNKRAEVGLDNGLRPMSTMHDTHRDAAQQLTGLGWTSSGPLPEIYFFTLNILKTFKMIKNE